MTWQATVLTFHDSLLTPAKARRENWQLPPDCPPIWPYVNGFVPASQKRRPPGPNLNRRVGISTSTQSCAPGSTNSFNAFSKTSSGMLIAYCTVSLSIYSFSLPGSWYRLQSHWKIFAFASSTVMHRFPTCLLRFILSHSLNGFKLRLLHEWPPYG